MYNMHLIALLKFWIVCQIRRICLDKTAVILNMKQMWIQVKWTLNKRLTWDCITHLVIHAHLCSSKSKVFEKKFFLFIFWMSSGVGHLGFLINTRNEDSIYSICDLFSHLPISSYAKTMSCGGSHLRFQIDTKNTHFVKDHSMNMPAIFVVK